MTSAEKDRALIERWQTRRDNAARAELVRRYAPMIDRAARAEKRDDTDDLVAEGSLAFLRAIDEYDRHGSTAFARFAGGRVVRAIERYVAYDLVPPDFASGVQDSPEEFATASETRRLRRADLIEAMASLTDREADVITRRYLGVEETPQFEVATALGVSRQRIHQIEQDAIAKLRRAMGAA